MRKTYKRMAIVGIAVALVVLISFPTNAITAGTSLKKLTSKKNLKDVASNVTDNVRHGLEKIKNRVVNRMNDGNRKLNSGNGVHICKMQARKTMATSNLLGKPLFYPMCTLDNGDELSINITDVGAEPQYADYNESVNITCVVTSELTVDIVNVTISGPSEFDSINVSMNSSGDTKYYYNISYNINGTYDYYIWAKNESTGNQSISDIYFFYAGNWPPQITNVGHVVNDNFANISCTVTDDDDNDTDNVSTVKVIVLGNTSGNNEFSMTNINGTDTYYSNESYVNDTYTYYIWANDTSGNINETIQKIFTIGEETVTKVVQVTNYPGDEIHPSSEIIDNEGNMIVLLESDSISDSDICYKISTNGGEEWPEDIDHSGYWSITGNQTYPHISTTSDGDIWGTFETDHDKTGIPLISPDLTISILCWDDDTYDMRNVSQSSISTWNDEIVIVSFVADVYNKVSEETELSDIPMFLYYNIDSEGGFTLYFDTIHEDIPDLASFSHSATTTDNGISIIYEAKNLSADKTEILALVWSGDPPSDTDDLEKNWTDYILQSEGNLTSPSVTEKNQNIFIAVESEYEGSYDLLIYNSSDAGQNWTEDNIVVSDDSERYPILYSDNDHIYCTYYKSGNLYLVESTDGSSWSTPEQINDDNGKVVDDYHTADIADEEHFIWTDSRNSDETETNTGYDLYCAILGAAPLPPQDIDVYFPYDDLRIESMQYDDSGEFPIKNLLVFTVGNRGNKSAKDVEIKITAKGSDLELSLPIGNLGIIDAQETQENRTRILFSISLIDILNSVTGRSDNGIMGSEGFKGLAKISQIKVELDPFGKLTNETRGNNIATLNNPDFNIKPLDVTVIEENDPSLNFLNRFNIEVKDNSSGIPVESALIIYGSISKLRKIPVSLLHQFLKKIKIWRLAFKFRTKLLLQLVKIFLSSACIVASHVGLSMTDQDGKSVPSLKAPSKLLPFEKQLPLFIITSDGNIWAESITI